MKVRERITFMMNRLVSKGGDTAPQLYILHWLGITDTYVKPSFGCVAILTTFRYSPLFCRTSSCQHTFPHPFLTSVNINLCCIVQYNKIHFLIIQFSFLLIYILISRKHWGLMIDLIIILFYKDKSHFILFILK